MDNVNNPPHYKRGGLEVIDVIEAFGLNFHLGNVVKYVLRHKDKDGLQDLNSDSSKQSFMTLGAAADHKSSWWSLTAKVTLNPSLTTERQELDSDIKLSL
jgi:hypothetical protein